MEWQIIESYFRDNRDFITKHHLDSYNHFIRTKLPDLIKNIKISVTKNDEQQKPKHEIKVLIGGEKGDAIYIAKPVYKDGESVRPLYPNDACVKNMYYSSDIYADIIIKYKTFSAENNSSQPFDRVCIGTIPIMVNSCLCVLHEQSPRMIREMGSCNFDRGGFFIVDGKEKIIIGQERIVTNRLFVTIPNDGNFAIEAQIQCTTEGDEFKKTVMFWVCNANDTKHPNSILVRIPDVAQDVPVIMAFRALGIESDRRIMEYIIGDSDSNPEMAAFLFYSLHDNKNRLYTQEAVLNYLKEFVRYKNIDHVKHIIVNDFLRNTGPSLRMKALFLGQLVNKLVKTKLGMLSPNNRDSFTHKRLDVSGELIYQLFRDFYNKLRKNIRKTIEAKYTAGGWTDIKTLVKVTDIPTIFDSSIISNAIKQSLKGNWNLENDPEKAGIVQDLNRISYAGYQSHARRMNTPMSRDLKLTQPRKLDATQWGVACPIHSPDGASIGLDKHLAMLTYVTLDINSMVYQNRDHWVNMDKGLEKDLIPAIHACLEDLGTKRISNVGLNEIAIYTKVFINNNLFGIHDDPKTVVHTMRLYRRNGLINAFISIVWNEDIYVFCQSGRLTRPLLIVKDNKILHKSAPIVWKDLFNGINKGRDLDNQDYVPLAMLQKKLGKNIDLEQEQAPLEFIDVEESFNTLIAMFPEELIEKKLRAYTHCEIHPTTILGLYTNSIPYAHHNPAARNVFACAQGKQAIGVYSTNFNNRMDTMSYVLHYPQMPLVTTRYNVMTGNDALPAGENLIVAIMTYTGYNIEDAIIVNKSSIESGMFNLTYFKSFIDNEEESLHRGNMTMFCNPHDLPLDMKRKYCNIDTVDEHGMPKLNAYIEEDDMMLGKLNVKISNVDGKRTTEYKDASKIADKTIEGVIDKIIVFKNEEGNRTTKVRMRQFCIPMLGDKLASRHSQKGVIGMIFNKEDMPFTKNGLVPDIIINPHAIPSRMTVAHLLECLVSKAGALGGYRADATIFENHMIDKHKDVLAENGFEIHGNEVMYSGITGQQIEADIFIGPTYYGRSKHIARHKINYRMHGPVSTLTRQPARGRAVDGGLKEGEMEVNAIIANGLILFQKESFIEKSDGFAMKYEDKNYIVPYAFKLLQQELSSLNVNMNFNTKLENIPEDDYIEDMILLSKLSMSTNDENDEN